MRVIGLGLRFSNKRGFTNLCYVNDEDFELCSKFRWHSDKDGYAIASKTTKMHRLILGVTNPKIEVDHINHNKLDNRRENLRLCSRSQNSRNLGPQSNSRSGIRGVSWSDTNKHWISRISHNDKQYLLVTTKDLELAAKTYAYFDKLIGGEFHSNHPYYDSNFYPTKLTPSGKKILRQLIF